MPIARVAASGRGVGFNPSFRKTAGALWLRGDSLLQSSGSVTGWADKFGNWANFIAVVSPTYVASSPLYGGRAVASFNGASAAQYLGQLGFSIAQPDTVYCIGRNTLSNTSFFDGGGSNRQLIHTVSSGVVYNMFAGTELSSGINLSGPHAFCCVFNSTTSNFYIDASQTPIVTGNAGTDGWITTAANAIGRTQGSATGVVGEIAEIIAFPGADTAAQRAAMFAYFEWYYSLPLVA